MRYGIPTVQAATPPPPLKKEGFGSLFFRWMRAAVFCGAAIPIGIVGFVQWRGVEESKIEARLKEHMLDRGMSAAEIDKVLRAPHYQHAHAHHSPFYTTQHAELEAKLIRDLVQLGMSAENIEKVLKVASVGSKSQDAATYESTQRAGKRAQFIKELAERGRTAAEIERLVKLHYRVPAEDSDRAATVAADDRSPSSTEVEGALKVLLRSGVSPDDLAKLLKSDESVAGPMPVPAR